RRREHPDAVRELLTLEDPHGRAWYRRTVSRGLTASAIAAQPDWLRALRVDDRLPEGARVLFTGCGTSFHAALAAGTAAQALEVVLGDAPAADVLVAVSHEGETALTLEAVQAFAGESWLITGKAEAPLAATCDHVGVATP